MAKDRYYLLLKAQISNLLQGLSQHKELIPASLVEELSSPRYDQALQQLEKRKQKLEAREEDYRRAHEKYQKDYELVRKMWKKDVIRLKRVLKKEKDKLEDFGIR